MPSYKYPVAKPDLTGNESKYVNEAVDTGWVSSTGPFVERFEEAFANHAGTKYAVACSSGTTALTLALRAAGVQPGDEVIVPEFTMVATAWAVSYLGAKPVFVDCGKNLNIDVSALGRAVSAKTKAIIPVHIYGRVANMDKIKQFVKGRGIKIIEDAAEAHGAEYVTKKVGAIGDIGCFSLYGNKIITAGEGGIITTNDKETADSVRYLRSMAFDPDHTFLHRELGYNFRMTNLQAAVALAQTERLDEFLAKREEILSWYDKYLKEYTIERPKGSVLWMYDVVLDSDVRERMIRMLAAKGIESRRFFKPMSQQPMYEKGYLNLKAYAYGQAGLYLPAYTDLTQDNVEEICMNFLQCLTELTS